MTSVCYLRSYSFFQISVHYMEPSVKDGDECLLVIKGAPERVLDLCKTIVMKGETVPLSDRIRSIVDSACLNLASQGTYVTLKYVRMVLVLNCR